MTPCPDCGHWISEQWVHHCRDVASGPVVGRPWTPGPPPPQEEGAATATLDQLRERWKGDMDR